MACPQTVKLNQFLCADDSCFAFQGKNVKEIEKQLNGDFTNICKWFVINRPNIHFSQDKLLSIPFFSKRKIKKIPKLNIAYKNIQMKQHSKAAYFG